MRLSPAMVACATLSGAALIGSPQAGLERIYRDLAASVEVDRIAATYLAVGKHRSRISGSDGERATLAFAESELRAMGAVTIRREEFAVAMPDPNAVGTLGGQGWSVRALPLWPNLVRTSTCDVSGPIVYGGDGSLRALKGKAIDGAIVLLEFESGANWRNVAKLGAAAILFLGPERAHRGEAEHKFAAVPINMPRFYLPLRSSGPALRAAAHGEVVRLKCDQRWLPRRTYNLIAEFPGGDPAATVEPVVLMAHADASSIVPGLAPGAESAGGLAVLLETARIHSKRVSRRPLRLVVSAGHFASLLGTREYVERRLVSSSAEALLHVTLDIDSGSGSLGCFGRGWFYEYRDESQEPIRGIARTLRRHAERMVPILGTFNPRSVLADAVNHSDNRTWRNNIPAKFAFDCEPLVQAGYSALTLATIDSSRERCDTPFDTNSGIDLANVARQAKVVACLLHHVLNDTTDQTAQTDLKLPLESHGPRRMGLVGGFSTVEGRVAIYDPGKSFVPDITVPGSIVVNSSWQKTLSGVRGSMVQLTDGKEAEYKFLGVPPVSSYPRNAHRITILYAYKLDERTGEIVYAPNFSDESYTTVFDLKQAYRASPIIVFPCVSLDFYDLFDPQELRSFMSGNVVDAATDAYPRQFGLAFGRWDDRLNSEVETGLVMFGPKDLRFKSIMGGESGDSRLLLTNATPQSPYGTGYPMEQGAPMMKGVAALVARDILVLNQSRIEQFARYRIVGEGVNDLQLQGWEQLRLAERAVADKDWAEAERSARAAWALTLRAHPVLQRTAGDVVNGVLFYLFLLIPFSYFVERLVFASRSLTRQIAVAGAVFIASFAILRAVHPAFEIVTNPSMIFVGFIMGALCVIVISFILGKFESSLKTLKREESGIHEVDIGRVSVAMAAFNLGVSNMRRRKARTILTTLTLVVMTFIVLSFTSIVPELQIKEAPSDTPAAYTGMLVRMPALDRIENSIYRSLDNEFGERAAVARRAWFYGADIGEQGVLGFTRAERTTEARAIMGLDPSEAAITKPQKSLLPGGRWFGPGDDRALILPRPMAEQLKIDPSEAGKAKVKFAGEEFVVIGIFDPAHWRSFVDLDGDELLPADFTLSKQLQGETMSGSEAFLKFIRLDPSTVCLMPAETAMNLGAEIRSVAVGFKDPAETRKALDDLMPRLRLNLYAAVPVDGPQHRNAATPQHLEVRQFSVLQGSKGTGLGLVLIQLLIAGVFVLNTMVASVFERTKEISIFSAIGLAPNHIAMLFFAESLVYGVLGAVSGYILAQTVAKVIVATGALPGLYLNFSSTSAVISAALVMGIVVFSTIYPARKAAKIAAPALNEEAFKKEPEGDEWTIELPFNVGASEAAPLIEFFGEWLAAYEEYTIGDFVTSGTRLGGFESEHGHGYQVETTAWLAPYDLGVSQRLALRAIPTSLAGVYALDLVLTRLGGEPSNWVTVNRRFMASLRKQFLTWRTLDADNRAGYAERARATLEGAPA